MTITHRLLLTLSFALAALLFVGADGLVQLSRSQDRFETVQTNVIPSIAALDDLKGYLADTRLAGYRLSVFSNLQDKGALEDALAKANRQFDDALAGYEKQYVSDDNDRRLLDADRANMAAYRQALQPFLASARAGDMDGVRAALVAGSPLALSAAAVKKGLDEHIAYNMRASAAIRDTSTSAYVWSWRIMIVTMVVALAVTAGLAAHLYRVIRTSLDGIRTTLQRVSESLDLTLRAPVARMDEIGQTSAAFNNLLSRIAVALGAVLQSTQAVSVASKQIAAGNVDLSARTEEQAASLQETASSMEQLTGTVRHNADNAQQASSLAAHASGTADAGNGVVHRVVETMADIAGHSDKIADITGIIEGIAFQTNILALNAAVEAARAGEQGRGFAVVASEVRSLAQRSSSAAKEIKELIAASVERVREGSALADEAGRTIGDVASAVKRVTDIVGEIAAASNEQSRGIEQVNRAIRQMDEVTQQNAALVEQAAAAAQSLEDQGLRLTGEVGVFRVDGPRAAAV
ncbi:methyl-accepting chemotaxis protein [Trinickia caryophylli]|uniref:Methyl-accepting chemotaxis sensory transducer n=1 Tax=Trinickia caryophylli TaxID=28094 RepID=A0A1X7D0I3_TRICW|nr:methyl-accepting chemotaxis protein [Trinickia caryophylli]PMS13549.1 HAMP domain-containing protein [Trinickia caryophylli]TRX15286.1 HAMP domain-containing protein [Trinickia caryophylli]WQE15164.1 methyl-accepting chemotaxis protein [Trinickia caryophylli]SMF06392.1 methyl-accepting chemotaxis sensory transducer [Trinickia caryophylli]GLU31096.1 methyl-accepting chemotaxis protein [Trinickia caryophylli]